MFATRMEHFGSDRDSNGAIGRYERGAPGLTTSNKKLLGAKGMATRSDRTLLGALAVLLGARSY